MWTCSRCGWRGESALPDLRCPVERCGGHCLSGRLQAYLVLEQAARELETLHDVYRSAADLADDIRDLMDPLWFDLTDGEHTWLDARLPAGMFAATIEPSVMLVPMPGVTA